MRSLALVALLGVAASAAPYWIKTFYLLTKEGPEIRVESVKTGFVNIQINGLDTWRYGLSSEEAASLGRALLEAAGETENKLSDAEFVILLDRAEKGSKYCGGCGYSIKTHCELTGYDCPVCSGLKKLTK